MTSPWYSGGRMRSYIRAPSAAAYRNARSQAISHHLTRDQADGKDAGIEPAARWLTSEQHTTTASSHSKIRADRQDARWSWRLRGMMRVHLGAIAARIRPLAICGATGDFSSATARRDGIVHRIRSGHGGLWARPHSCATFL